MKLLIQGLVFLVVALAITSCDGKSSKLTPLAVTKDEAVTQKPSDFTTFNPKVDILFVIDNSGSMDTAQNNLSRNAAAFSDAITKMTILDYHIGVTSTDMEYCPNTSNYGSDCGTLMGSPYFVDRNTPNGAAALARNMLLGTTGSGVEEIFTPVMWALSNNINSPQNKGFYRQDAYLAVIFITDAKDQSNVDASALLNFLVAKKGDATKVLGYGVIRKLSEQYTCSSAEELDGKIESFLTSVINADKAQNNILSLCASDYGVKLAQFAKDIVKRSTGSVKLLRVPDVKTIQVTYGTQVIPNDALKGWVYEVSTNSIILSAGIDWVDQGPNVSLSVDFKAFDPTAAP